MVQDYAKKYTKHLAPRRKNSRYLWIILGISVSLFILGLFLLKSINKVKNIRPVEKILSKRNIQTSSPQLSEPKFDFYNILPQENLNLSPHIDSSMKEIPLSNDMTSSIHAAVHRSDTILSLTPEQLAIAEAKKQLEEEMGQLNKEIYVLVLGDFTDRIQAEQLQAQALLKGFSVQKKVSLTNEKPIYQIFMGPSELNKLIQEKKLLNRAGLDATLIKITS